MNYQDACEVVHVFWRLMATNDFYCLKQILAEDFVLEWPQSKERIRGAKNFAQINAEYPANGPWRFTVHRVFGNGAHAVSDVSVTDGVVSARAISFFETEAGKVKRLVEYWPEPYEAPGNRQHLVERME